ncbi:hypothetical protein S40293_03076 [Stachybotrys chartarum IBT 40293]|nr:hypothetical protein S40293_03076 [Stachybotrys chartarum IBT 40293]
MFGINRGVGMIVLQILRAFTVIGLCAAVASCWVLMLHLDQARSWFPFEGASIFFLSLLCLGLIISEFPTVNLVKSYIREYFAILGPESGLGWLGSCLVVIGCNLLGKLNQAAFDTRRIGDSYRQLILATGILNLIFGVFNVICTFVWSNRKEGVTARGVRSMGSLAGSPSGPLPKFNDISSYKSSVHEEKPKNKFVSMFWGKTDSPARPNISGPFHNNDYDEDIEDRQSPIVPGVKRPDTALHPMHTASSRYSEAAMSRF